MFGRVGRGGVGVGVRDWRKRFYSSPSRPVMLPSACLLFLVLLALMASPIVLAQAPYGLQERVPNNSLLIAPVEGRVPQTVSESGLFSNVAAQISGFGTHSLRGQFGIVVRRDGQDPLYRATRAEPD